MSWAEVVNGLRAELAAAKAREERMWALLSSARLVMRIYIPKPSCLSIGVIAQIDKAIGTAGGFCDAAGRGEGGR